MIALLPARLSWMLCLRESLWHSEGSAQHLVLMVLDSTRAGSQQPKP